MLLSFLRSYLPICLQCLGAVFYSRDIRNCHAAVTGGPFSVEPTREQVNRIPILTGNILRFIQIRLCLAGEMVDFEMEWTPATSDES
jgi:hypothetical protein